MRFSVQISLSSHKCVFTIIEMKSQMSSVHCFINYRFSISFSFFKIDFIYFLERGREGGREGEKRQCVVTAPTPPPPRTLPATRHVPWPGIELVTPWSAGWHSIHWAHQSGPPSICFSWQIICWRNRSFPVWICQLHSRVGAIKHFPLSPGFLANCIRLDQIRFL